MLGRGGVRVPLPPAVTAPCDKLSVRYAATVQVTVLYEANVLVAAPGEGL